MTRFTSNILITDAVGLVGAYIISALRSSSELQGQGSSSTSEQADSPITYKINAGYHDQQQLESSIAANDSPGLISPILVDWSDQSTYANAVKGIDTILLLTPFTSEKPKQVKAWMDAISDETKQSTGRAIHIVYIGVHTDPDDEDRPIHETWQLEAEEIIKAYCPSSAKKLSCTLLRINFDGYNTILRPNTISYFLPLDKAFGWMAREDIALFSARILLEWRSHKHDHVYILSSEQISLREMASVASRIVGFEVSAEERSIDNFLTMALAAEKDEGYAAYIKSVAKMFSGLHEGKYAWHTEAYPKLFVDVVGKNPMSFEEWLVSSPSQLARLQQK